MIFSKRYLRARGNSELLSKLLQQSVQYAYIWLEPIYIQTEQKVISGGCEDFPINPMKHLPKNSIINITKQIIRYSFFLQSWHESRKPGRLNNYPKASDTDWYMYGSKGFHTRLPVFLNDTCFTSAVLHGFLFEIEGC